MCRIKINISVIKLQITYTCLSSVGGYGGGEPLTSCPLLCGRGEKPVTRHFHIQDGSETSFTCQLHIRDAGECLSRDNKTCLKAPSLKAPGDDEYFISFYNWYF